MMSENEMNLLSTGEESATSEVSFSCEASHISQESGPSSFVVFENVVLESSMKVDRHISFFGPSFTANNINMHVKALEASCSEGVKLTASHMIAECVTMTSSEIILHNFKCTGKVHIEAGASGAVGDSRRDFSVTGRADMLITEVSPDVSSSSSTEAQASFQFFQSAPSQASEEIQQPKKIYEFK